MAMRKCIEADSKPTMVCRKAGDTDTVSKIYQQ